MKRHAVVGTGSRAKLYVRALAGGAGELVAFAAGCSGGGGDEKITLRFVWWGNQDRATLTEQALKLFEDRNPTIDVRTSFQNFQTYWEKLATETAGGNPPDVMQMDYRCLNEYAGRSVLLDLSPAAAEETPLGTRKSASEHSYDSLFSGYDGVRKGELRLANYPSADRNTLGSYRKPSQLIAASNRGEHKDAAVS